MKLSRLLILIACCCGPASTLFAQDEAAPRSFRVLGYGEGDFKGISFETEGEEGPQTLALDFVPNRKSRAYVVAEGQGRLEFFREDLNSRGKPVRRELAKIDWPRDAERVLLVFLESGARDGEPAYDLVALDESAAVWGPRCVRFLNLSGAVLDARMQQYAFPLEEGASEVLCFEGEYSIPMTLELSLPWRGQKQVVYSARFVADQYSPQLLVVKPPLEQGSLEVVVDTLW